MKTSLLKVRDRVIVRNGGRGEQIAVICSVTRNGTARAHKWLMRGARWTKPVTLYDVDVLRYASAADFAKRRVKVAAPIDGVRS